MGKKVVGFLYFAVTVVILVVVLKVTNWLPSALQEGAMREYGSIEEVRARLQVRDIIVPSYFPQSFKWPPSRILAQSRPFFAIIMEFRHQGTGEVALIIHQTSGADFTADKKITIGQIKERVTYPLKGRAALLEVGACKGDSPCSRISWNEGNYRVKLAMRSAPFDLIKIAESMIH